MEHTKSFNTQGGKNRLRFASAKSRAKSASADVYRSSDRRLTSSATAVREKRVHNGGVAGASAASPGGANKRRKKGKVEFGNNNSNRGGEGGEDEVRYFGRDNDAEGLDMGRTAVIVSSKSKLRLDDADVNLDAVDGDYQDDDDEEEERDKTLLLTGGTIFRTELEVAAQRNGSQLFQKLTHELRQSCKSLAELLHHAEKIVELLCAYLLSPRGNGMGFHSPVRGASEDLKAFKKRMSEKAPNGFVVNVATNDVLHLFGVLARELRQEIYPFLHSRILPRIIDDMLNPPTTTAVTVSISSSGGTQQEQDTHQNVPLDVSHIESALRALSYLFKYNSDQLIYNHPTDSPSKTKLNGEGKQAVGDADILRQYYGKTICHKRDIVRRLACESYAPLLRKCLDKGLKRHLSRTIKALASSIAAATMTLEEENVEEEGAMEVDNENDGAIHMTNSMRKAREDAIDGVSSLLFEVSRGAPGRVHSKKGRLVVRAVMDCLTSFCNGANGGSKHGKNDDKENGHRLLVEKNKADAVYEVASQFMFKLRGHVIRGTREEIIVVTSSFVDVLDEFHRALNSITSMMKEASSTIVAHVLGIVVDLISETITFQDGRLVHDGQIHRGEGEADRIAVSLQALLSNDIYSKSGVKLQNQILQYLCSAWRANPSHPSFATRLGKFFPSIVSPKNPEPSASSTEEASFLDPALVLAQNLLLHLPKKVASTSLIPALLSAAASPIGKDGNADASLVLLHTISTAVWPNDDLDADIDDSEADALFTWEAAELCPGILPKVRSALFDICLSDDMKNLSFIEKKKSSPRSSRTGLSAAEQLARVGFASRCIPFLVCLECADNSDEDSEDDNASVENEQSEEVLNRVFKWFASTLKHIDAILTNQTGTIVEQINVYVAQSLLLESFSKCAVECYNRLSSSSIASSLKKTMSKAKSYASSLLVLQPKSIWVVKGVAAVVKSLGIIDPGTKINDRSNEMFELLAPNLAQSNHFLRLNTLEILASYPARPFVTDHADLDLTDDLDEEPSQRPQPVEEEAQTNEDNSAATSLSGSCDIMSLLRVIESTPITMPNQRKLTSQLGRVEVYARTGKLPIVYAEATALHMLGLLHVKFAPVWPAAVQVIVALSSAQEGPTWPCIEAALKESMERPSPGATLRTKAKELDAKKKTDQRNKSRHIETIAKHHALCVSWETSKGKNHDIFHSHDGERNGQVSRHVEADDLTRFESIWSIMENAPHLTSTKSKMIVPIFFEFMLAQFYVFHSDDPDAREICLTENMDEFSCIEWPREELGRKSVQKKFESFLRMFAAVKGPQQLFKHKLLLQLSIAFLSNPDAKIANLAFSCVLRFKLPYLLPYAEYVQPMLKKEGLREALTKFDLSENSEIVDISHRLDLIPIVTRILFGRFSARGNGAKSSKDSPAARRAAILSFFSGIGNVNGEINYFVYMMVRVFIPEDMNMIINGPGLQSEHLERMIESSGCITPNGLLKVPIKRQEGFLNLFYDVIVQIGYGVKHFIPYFANLLLALCEQTEDAFIVNMRNQSADNEELDDDESTVVERDDYSRIGRVRSLCFLRLKQMLSKFAASSVDFSKYGKRLWKSMSSSVVALPNTVINAENPPSLLQLIEVIALHRELIPLLDDCNDVVLSVFKCVAGTTRSKVMSCVLRIIDGLLTEGGTLGDTRGPDEEQSVGQALILKHIHLLISQFTKRLKTDSRIANLDEEITNNLSGKGKAPKNNPTEGLQLNVLCRVSELLVSARQGDDENIATMESLCALLVPSLKFDSHPKQLYVMRTIKSLIPRLSNEAAMSHYYALSKLLGPNKAGIGLTSNEARQIIASAISAIGGRGMGLSLNKVVEAVVELNAASASYVDEHDFERILPVLNSLGASSDSEGSWFDLSKESSDNQTHDCLSTFGGPRILLPVLFTCFQLLYDSDGVVSRASNKALKTIVTTCLEQAQASKEAKEDLSRNPWLKFIETTFVPCLKVGIMTKNLTTRRNFVLLIAHVSKLFSDFESPHLYGDLNCLIREDDQDLDFFLNLTHVQMHRRARAFTRLRKLIADNETAPEKSPIFSDQSYGNVLLPLAMHPVYEYNSQAEETYVVEAIATVGEISKHLPWTKYNTTLQSVLNNLERYPGQERFLIAMMCAIIDAFHFSVDTGESSPDTAANEPNSSTTNDQAKGSGTWRSLKNRIIPKVESFLVKEKVDKHGHKNKCLRASVALALMKLFQKLPVETFESKLPKLITVICNGMKNKDSDQRDIARDTISKMAVSLDMKYLPLILSELSVSLSEGYKLHVRSAALHSILVSISKVYERPHVSSIDEAVTLSFDRCVPAMMDLIHQDIFGKASEIKEAQHVEKRLIKEAMGSKSQDSLEIISRAILFRPSLVAAHASAVHALVTPFLERLRNPEVSPSTIGKSRECLNRIAVGFSHNTSATYVEVLPFVYGTVSPFVYGNIKRAVDEDADLENSDEELEAPIQVSTSKREKSTGKKSRTSNGKTVKSVAVATWTPSSLGTAENQQSALDMKKNQKLALHRVTDGAVAPKLTGSSRHRPLKSSTTKTLNNPANACAVNFGLALLNSCLKRLKLDLSDDLICSMADPYLPLLTHCVRFSSDNRALVSSLKCLGILLRLDLPSVLETAKELGPGILDHLTASNAASNTQSDIVQGCFKTLTLLISHQKFASAANQSGEVVGSSVTTDIPEGVNHNGALPLSTDQMQALLSLLHSSVRESDHHNATFGLVKAISSKRFMSPEFYDLMDIILKLSVQSQKSTIRLLSSQIFLQYLLEYPMGKQRIDNHLQQIVLNIKYEYEEGRLSAVDLLSSAIQKFPLPILESHSQLFFLPLVLQLVNDDSKKCKEAVANCISLLLKRLTTDTVQSMFDYVKRWSQSSGSDSTTMQRASAQLFGIFVESRPDYVKRGNNASDLISLTLDAMTKCIPFNDDSEWELLYFNLVCTEKISKELPSLIELNYNIWDALIKFLAFPHPWVMQISSRIISNHLSTLDPIKVMIEGPDSFIVKIPGCLYNIARNLCRQLDVDDKHFVESTSILAIKTITWVFRAMKHNPTICYADESNESDKDDIVEDDNPKKKSRDACRWVMARLSNIAKPKGNRRRESVFKCFAALCASCTPDQLIPYLELIIDPIDRAIREAANNLRPDDQESSPIVALPKDVLQLFEDSCGTDKFLKAYAKVNRKARQKRDSRKQEIASEAVHDPESAAKRKIKKQFHEKERRKRRVEDRRSMRGASKKKRF